MRPFRSTVLIEVNIKKKKSKPTQLSALSSYLPQIRATPMGKQNASHPHPLLQSPPATRGGMEHEEQNDPVAQSFVSKSLLIGSATTTADSSEGDNREEPVVREEEIDETEV